MKTQTGADHHSRSERSIITSYVNDVPFERLLRQPFFYGIFSMAFGKRFSSMENRLRQNQGSHPFLRALQSDSNRYKQSLL